MIQQTLANTSSTQDLSLCGRQSGCFLAGDGGAPGEDLLGPRPGRHLRRRRALVQVGIRDAGHHFPLRAPCRAQAVARRGFRRAAEAQLLGADAPAQVEGRARRGGTEVVAEAEVAAVAIEASLAVLRQAPATSPPVSVHLHHDGGWRGVLYGGRLGGNVCRADRGACTLRGRLLRRDVQRARSLPAFRLRLAGRRRPGSRELQQVCLRAAELAGLLLQARGGHEELGGGARVLMEGRHADMRVVVGLQVHCRDVTYFTFVSVQHNKDKNVGVKVWIGFETNPGFFCFTSRYDRMCSGCSDSRRRFQKKST